MPLKTLTALVVSACLGCSLRSFELLAVPIRHPNLNPLPRQRTNQASNPNSNQTDPKPAQPKPASQPNQPNQPNQPTTSNSATAKPSQASARLASWTSDKAEPWRLERAKHLLMEAGQEGCWCGCVLAQATHFLSGDGSSQWARGPGPSFDAGADLRRGFAGMFLTSRTTYCPPITVLFFSFIFCLTPDDGFIEHVFLHRQLLILRILRLAVLLRIKFEHL